MTVNINDVGDTKAMSRLVRNQEIIFNLAGQVSHIDRMLDPFADLDVNCRWHSLRCSRRCRTSNP